MPINAPRILELGNDFYDEVKPAHFPQSKLGYVNNDAFKSIGLDLLGEEEIKKYFWHFSAMKENLQTPLALRYHGHQFMHYNSELGDGRGFLYAQFISNDLKLLDVGTKGSGQTPYSRRGDGRLTLKGAIREALATEMLESLAVNTSKTLVFFETGEALERNDEPSPTRSAVLSRLSHSHIRFGTFQRLAYLQQSENMLKLVEYSLKNYFPDLFASLKNSSNEEKIENFFQRVVELNADLVASIMMSGFVHGVLNTDNMNITGELFDYGPYRFLPEYDPNFVAAYFDHQGLYAFGRQPSVFFWNLEQLAKSLKSAAPEANLTESLNLFSNHFNKNVLRHFLRRLNIQSPAGFETKWAEELLSLFFDFIYTKSALFEQSFFDLHSGIDFQRLKRSPLANLYLKENFIPLRNHLQNAVISDRNKQNLTYFKRIEPETLLIGEIEKIWNQIESTGDWTLFHEKIKSIRSFRGAYS